MGSYCLLCKNKKCPNVGMNVYIGWECPDKENIKEFETEDEIIEELSNILVELGERNHGNSGIWFDDSLDYVHLCEYGKSLLDKLAYGDLLEAEAKIIKSIEEEMELEKK